MRDASSPVLANANYESVSPFCTHQNDPVEKHLFQVRVVGSLAHHQMLLQRSSMAPLAEALDSYQEWSSWASPACDKQFRKFRENYAAIQKPCRKALQSVHPWHEADPLADYHSTAQAGRLTSLHDDLYNVITWKVHGTFADTWRSSRPYLGCRMVPPRYFLCDNWFYSALSSTLT